MARFITATLGDRLVLTDERTGDQSLIDLEGPRRGEVRLKLNLPEQVRFKHIKLDDRIGSDPRVASESEPTPLGSTRVASAMQIAEAHAAGDGVGALLPASAYITGGVIHGNTAHPFVDPIGGVR